MIEKICHLIIQDLGPTGLLVVGLYFIFFKHLAKIARHIEIINHTSTKQLDLIERCADRLCDAVDHINAKINSLH